MFLTQLIHNYADYNLWANRKTINWLEAQPQELMDFELPSSFPTIRSTLWHIQSAERFWLNVLHGNATTSFSNPMPENMATLFAQYLAKTTEFTAYVKSLSEEELQANCALEQPWMKGVVPRFEFIQHCINHGTYHRGQIITIARNTGITNPPITEYAIYLIKEKQ
jgi:uncharacterized damage-inducible protein DinB